MNMHDDTTQSPTIYCSQCGHQVPDKRFCMFCGAPLMKSGPATQDRFDLTVEQNTSSRRPITELPEGTRIGDYTIGSRIGSGGFGTVYSAYHQFADDAIALKLIPITSPEMIDAIKNEFAVRRKIAEFTNVVRAWQPSTVTYQDQNLLVYPMELMVGDLSERVPRDAPTLQAKWIRAAQEELFPEICTGIVQCHRHGILHLDIKPSNVLLDSAGTPKVTDFGISRISRSVASSSSVGTIGYAAPEQLQGGNLDERTDIYALGVLLLELTTGSRDTTAYESLSEKYPSLSDVIDRCTRHIPSRRFQSVEELINALKRDSRHEKRSTKHVSSIKVRVYVPFHKINKLQQQKGAMSSLSRRSVEEWISITGNTVRYYYKVPRVRKLSHLFQAHAETTEREILKGEIVPPGVTVEPHRRTGFIAMIAMLVLMTLVAGTSILIQRITGRYDLVPWNSTWAGFFMLVGFGLLFLFPKKEARGNRRFTLRLSRLEITTTSGSIGPVLIEPKDAATITHQFRQVP